MSYKINALPSPKAYNEEKADFWEVEALKNFGDPVSQSTISKILSVGSDELSHEGITSEDDETYMDLDETFNELDLRNKKCAGGYPYELGKFSVKTSASLTDENKVYVFLLLCTRFNMFKDKVQNSLDGTLIFERISALVLREYLGENAKSIVFGTAVSGSFEDKVEDLIEKIGEGVKFKNPNKNPPTKNDDGIDVVGLLDFFDQEPGKLIAFGQCKTGTTWRNEIQRLNPQRFCSNWLFEQPILYPIPVVFLTDVTYSSRNIYTDQKDYLVFNRFRIMQNLPSTLPIDVQQDIITWVDGALVSLRN